MTLLSQSGGSGLPTSLTVGVFVRQPFLYSSLFMMVAKVVVVGMGLCCRN